MGKAEQAMNETRIQHEEHQLGKIVASYFDVKV